MRRPHLACLFAVICCHASASEATSPLTVPSADKKSSITIELREGWKTYPAKDGCITIEVPRSGVNIQVRALSQASVDDAVTKVADLIKDQVTHFKLTGSKPLTVAGAAGKMLTGTGEEADDGDPSNAEIYLFAIDGGVYMICAHGEGDIRTKSREIIPALLSSVKKG